VRLYITVFVLRLICGCIVPLVRKKEMGGDENMVLNHIQTSGNEGEVRV
jgi:hypothetical protein